MSDIPVTSRDFALKAKQVAEEAGVRQVHLGNVHLLY
jgi:hypothetical protein